jgi:AAA+ ATPase superfamily predicted ATPase
VYKIGGEMMANPFKYGKVVSGEDFADRTMETKQLVEDLRSGQNILLYSPRRYGKTSLIIRALDILRSQGVIIAYIDLFRCVTLSDLADKIVQEVVVQSQGKIDKIAEFFKDQISGVRPEFRLNSDGSIAVTLKKEIESMGPELILSKVLDVPEKVAENRQKRVVVAFDEFQEITSLNEGKNYSIEKAMRSSFQVQKDVTFLFAGSKQHMLAEMFGKEKRPFYKFAKAFPIGKIPLEEFVEFILTKFKDTTIDVSKETVDKMLFFTQGHPYITQQLCHEVWNIANDHKKVEQTDVEKAIKVILTQHGDYFGKIWDSLKSNQKKLMVAIAQEGTAKNIYSVSFIEKYNLLSASHVKRSLNQLESEALLERSDEGYYIEDVFLREWVRTTACACGPTPLCVENKPRI